MAVLSALLGACGSGLNNGGGPGGGGGDGGGNQIDSGVGQKTDAGTGGNTDGSRKTTCSNPIDKAGCTCSTANATMACYTGPTGTENVGACKDGTETCKTSGTSEFPTWSSCTGETLPSTENCSDGIDNDCNGLTDCADPACTGTPGCTNTNNCIAPNEVGPDDTRCPAGYWLDPSNINGYCCPCTANSCNNPNNFGQDAACCMASVCAGASTCTGSNCGALPASCNGQTDTDCDDWPEDCDEPCCACVPTNACVGFTTCNGTFCMSDSDCQTACPGTGSTCNTATFSCN
jgi:hypothetical protein